MANEVEFQIISLLKDLQKRITYLEKKIDMLVGQSTERSSKVKSYSQAPRTYGGPKRYNDNRESSFGTKNAQTGRYKDNRESPFEMKNTQTGRSFEKKRSNEGRGFPKNNKAFNPTSKKRSGKSK